MFLESRFNGTDHMVDGYQPVTPFRLSERSQHIGNWASVVDRLPEGWDHDEFHIAGTPYAWCEALFQDCDCHAKKGRLDMAYCSDFGLHDEIEKRKRKSENIRYVNYIKGMEQAIANRDQAQRKERVKSERPGPNRSVVPGEVHREKAGGVPRRGPDELTRAIKVVNGLIGQGFYCSIHGRHHPFGEQAIRKTMASLIVASAQLSTWDKPDRSLAMLGTIGAHWLRTYQSEECAQKSVWGDADVPDILYKYIPRERIGEGAPDTLRATQLLALNDDMECNVSTMKDSAEEETLAFLRLVQTKIKEHLDIEVPWEELLTRTLRYGDLRLSTFIQEYLNPRVGVVSFSADILVPTMWAHYARNSGIVVGYDTEALRALGFELRPVVYSELAPNYNPTVGDTIVAGFCQPRGYGTCFEGGPRQQGVADPCTYAIGAIWKRLGVAVALVAREGDILVVRKGSTGYWLTWSMRVIQGRRIRMAGPSR